MKKQKDTLVEHHLFSHHLIWDVLAKYDQIIDNCHGKVMHCKKKSTNFNYPCNNRSLKTLPVLQTYNLGTVAK